MFEKENISDILIENTYISAKLSFSQGSSLILYRQEALFGLQARLFFELPQLTSAFPRIFQI